MLGEVAGEGFAHGGELLVADAVNGNSERQRSCWDSRGRYMSENILPPLDLESRAASTICTVTASAGALKCLETAAVMSSHSAFFCAALRPVTA